ncbi:MAG TPA: hypothetical protein VMF57_06715 [Solirubrobacteraceae bacterium]|nr:hypothetical protein [Solirubrobacteraceae bacterium]
MTTPASAFLTYLWHYMVARLLYDELVRGHVLPVLVIVAIAVVGVVLRGRRRI